MTTDGLTGRGVSRGVQWLADLGVGLVFLCCRVRRGTLERWDW